jgi:hypothetical protein
MLDIVQVCPYIIDMTKVRMQRFVIWVKLNGVGDVVSVQAQDNDTFEAIDLDLSYAPDFVADRIALLKLTDVNKREKGELIGRRLANDVLIVYLTYDEYQQIKEECK